MVYLFFIMTSSDNAERVKNIFYKSTKFKYLIGGD